MEIQVVEINGNLIVAANQNFNIIFDGEKYNRRKVTLYDIGKNVHFSQILSMRGFSGVNFARHMSENPLILERGSGGYRIKIMSATHPGSYVVSIMNFPCYNDETANLCAIIGHYIGRMNELEVAIDNLHLDNLSMAKQNEYLSSMNGKLKKALEEQRKAIDMMYRDSR